MKIKIQDFFLLCVWKVNGKWSKWEWSQNIFAPDILPQDLFVREDRILPVIQPKVHIPTHLATCGPPRVVSLIKDNTLLSSVSSLFFYEGAFEQLAGSRGATAPHLWVHSTVFLMWSYLALAPMGKANWKRVCEWPGSVSQKVPLVCSRGKAFGLRWAGRGPWGHFCGERRALKEALVKNGHSQL